MKQTKDPQSTSKFFGFPKIDDSSLTRTDLDIQNKKMSKIYFMQYEDYGQNCQFEPKITRQLNKNKVINLTQSIEKQHGTTQDFTNISDITTREKFHTCRRSFEQTFFKKITNNFQKIEEKSQLTQFSKRFHHIRQISEVIKTLMNKGSNNFYQYLQQFQDDTLICLEEFYQQMQQKMATIQQLEERNKLLENITQGQNYQTISQERKLNLQKEQKKQLYQEIQHIREKNHIDYQRFNEIQINNKKMEDFVKMENKQLFQKDKSSK